MIEFRHVSVNFSTGKQKIVSAVKDISFSIEDGEIFGIVGASGAGKSTLLRTINGIEKTSAGDILVDGKAINQCSHKELSKIRGEIGMIFQHFNLTSSKTVAQNIAFPLQVAGKNRNEIKERVQELLKLVGLEDKESEYPSKLSGGQKQRVAIARALANNAKILLCDEPTSALDSDSTSSILELLKELSSRLGITIVIITHELSVVKNTCSRVAVLNGGMLVELNDVYELFTTPQANYTKRLIDSSQDFTLIPAVVKEIQTTSEAEGKYWTILKLTYVGGKASKPVISLTIKSFDININILHGRIEYVKDIPTGVLYISVNGELQEVERAISYIKSNVFKVEMQYEQQV